jgi:hypothetical protein
LRESSGWRLSHVRVTAQRSDGIEQLQPVPECCDAKLLQVLVRQARKDRLVYLVLAERCLILPKAKAPGALVWRSLTSGGLDIQRMMNQPAPA